MISDGGSMESDVTAVAVMPWSAPLRQADITVTVAGNLRMVARNASLIGGIAGMRPAAAVADMSSSRVSLPSNYCKRNYCQCKFLTAGSFSFDVHPFCEVIQRLVLSFG